MKKRIIDFFRQVQIAWYTAWIKAYAKCKKLGYVDEQTRFRETTKLFMKLVEVYTKRMLSGAVRPSSEVLKGFQELDALLHK